MPVTEQKITKVVDGVNPSIEASVSQVGAKGAVVVQVVDVDGNPIKSHTNTFSSYQYMGSQESGSYVYYGFKAYGAPDWYIARKDTTDPGAWKYAYSSDGGNSFTVAWSTPADESYGNPPD